MNNYLKVKCPKCHIVLIVDRVSGEVIETREALVAESTGDRFEDALQKMRRTPRETEEKFEKLKQAERTKHQDLDALFRKSLEQVKKEGPVDKQVRDIDLE